MTGHQIADTDHDDHVQDEDLTQKNDFRLGTLSTEEIPTSAGNVALLVRYVALCFLVFYDNKYSCLRLVRHRSNDASTGAQLLPNQCLGINPAVELGRVHELYK